MSIKDKLESIRSGRTFGYRGQLVTSGYIARKWDKKYRLVGYEPDHTILVERTDGDGWAGDSLRGLDPKKRYYWFFWDGFSIEREISPCPMEVQ